MKIEIAEPGRMTQTGSSLMKLIQNNNMPVLDLLVREFTQNSLDARKPDSKYVEVDYITGTFDNNRLSNELEVITTSLKKRFPALRYDFIAARDSNTVGLTGELDYKKVKNNDYGNLLKHIYEICKPQEAEGAGGSWGLGKTVYFRIGIGLVIYYSRIKTREGYASRLAASHVENETSPEAMIPVYHDQAKRGIAWWGELTGENVTQPVTDEKYIKEFLSIFNIDPYDGEKTGTTIIIPYIDREKLLSSNQVEYLSGNGQVITPPWCNSIESYIAVAAQRWYAPRLNNIHYTHGAFLRLRINGNGLALDDMEPVFRVIQALYNRANYVNEDDILTDTDAVVKVEEVKLRNCLNTTGSGNLAFAKIPRELLGMSAPSNKPEPYMYFNCEIRDDDVNRPTVCFTRKPAMIVSYENVGPWASNIAPTPKSHYIIAVYVLNSWNKLKNSPTPMSLEEYARKCEMADHTSWHDWTEGTYNPRIVSKVQNGVNKIISREFAPETEEAKPKAHSGLGKMFGEMLLPPDGFGKRPGPGPGPRPGPVSSRRGINFRVLADQIKYLEKSMIVPIVLETSGKKMVSNAGFELQIDSESKRMSVKEWEEKLGLLTPFKIGNCKIDAEIIDGQRVGKSILLKEESYDAEIDDIHISKQVTDNGTCMGLKISSETGHGVRMRITATVDINRKDVKPAFIFERENTNG